MQPTHHKISKSGLSLANGTSSPSAQAKRSACGKPHGLPLVCIWRIELAAEPASAPSAARSRRSSNNSPSGSTRTGQAEGENTQFNGDGFGRQKFTVRALDPADYIVWTARGDNGPTLDEATYATLRRRTVLADARGDLGLEKSAEPIVMTLGQQDMFGQIVAKYHGGEAERWGGTGLPQTGMTGAAE